MKTVHLIQHTHWDREWYFTENDSKAVLYYFMDDLLNRLEADPQLPPFVLDAQTVILDDYLEVAPENLPRLTALIRDGRILTGPWYTQTDFLVVGAESIARNLLLGIEGAGKYGTPMPVGYVPDSFGQSAQLPMFLNQFGIRHAVLWRGWSEHDVAKTEFVWHSDDGSKVTTAVLPWGYGCAKWLPADVGKALPGVMKASHKQAQFAATDHILLPNGNDQSPFEYQVPEMLQALNRQQDEFRYVNSSFSEFFEVIDTQRDRLPDYHGELLSPKYMRIHRGIFSTRTDIKKLNARLEKTLSQYLEPLLTVNASLGLPYPQTAVDNIWREAMKSHAHDSIGGCNSDRVNAMVKNRLLSGMEMAQQLLDLNFQTLSEGITATQDGTKILLFNSLPRQRSGIVTLTVMTPERDFRLCDSEGNDCHWQLVREQPQDMSTVVQELSNSTETTWFRKCELQVEVRNVPACGYTTLWFKPGEVSQHPAHTVNARQLENHFLHLRADAHGVLTLTDKRSGQHYHSLLQLVDGGDAGDNYNYSPPVEDWKITGDGHLIECRTDGGSLFNRMVLRYRLPVPQDLDSRQQRLTDARLDVTLTLTLAHNSPQLNVEITVDNQIRGHRLQLLMPTGAVSQVHFADQPFGLIQRDNQPAAMKIWQEENWTEAPAALYPMQSLVMMHDETRGLCAVTEGLREYEIPEEHNDVLAITLLRSVGWLGRANMPYRPGRASGMVLPSPDSQIPGIHHCSLAVMPLTGAPDADVWRRVEEWKTPMLAYLATGWSRFRLNPHGLKFPADYSLMSWDTPLHFSTLKKSQRGDHWVIRGWNPTARPVKTGIVKSSKKVTPSTLAEGKLSEARYVDITEAGEPVTFLIEK
ncbi:glycoside hydrolase family 38 C-terminal domain-containing protein [Rahnella victoriana]|uniref:glycoside hydrolase family 38 N-terminal domain-containing protein n=1 Tax=Rahnella victoriana TaxID=1510570 RepID=UPI00103F5A55|nr:glycoside hydrolase family 38 C-terminal domain-containing protein [Rahnella victoriana]TBX30931.1 alpha-mannosidase [Rahnella victoriana]